MRDKATRERIERLKQEILDLKAEVKRLKTKPHGRPRKPVKEIRLTKSLSTLKRKIKEVRERKPLKIVKEVVTDAKLIADLKKAEQKLENQEKFYKSRETEIAWKAVKAWERLAEQKITTFDELRLLNMEGNFWLRDIGIKRAQYLKFAKPYLEANYLKKNEKGGSYYVTYFGKERLQEIMNHIYNESI